tara:strand:- start:2605 stop:3309 length:705 start_codon:yes stop_codon:yes gene_type:complete
MKTQKYNEGIGTATDLTEVVDCWRIVYYEYLKLGFIEENPFQIFAYKEIINKRTSVYYSKIKSNIISTMSITLDDHSDLPLNKMFNDEINALRKDNGKLAEVGLLARKGTGSIRKYFYDIFLLMLCAHQYAIIHDLDYLIAGINPAHFSFYNRFFTFEKISEEKVHTGLNGQPVVLCKGDFIKQIKQCPIDKMDPAMKNMYLNPILIPNFHNAYDFDAYGIEHSIVGDFLEYLE